MRLFYLSDLHLHSAHDRNALNLEDFLRRVPKRGDTVALGGDVFDLFVGARKVFLKRFAPILTAMKDAESRGVILYYLEGNHDFHLSRVFRHHPNILVKTGDIELRLHNYRVHISHGDEIDGEDKGYLLLRAVTRSPVFTAVTALLPDLLYSTVGKWSSRTSRKYTGHQKQSRSERVRDLFRAFAAAKVEQGTHLVLIGHSHLADQVDFQIDGTARGTYLNLGYSEDELKVAEFNVATGRVEVKSHRAEKSV